MHIRSWHNIEDALFAGNLVLVSKLNYGHKMPSKLQDLPWLNLLFENTSDSLKKN